MAVFLGNIGFRVTIQLQSRVLLFPWVREGSAIWCSGSRDYSSSVPVRYTPKVPLKGRKQEKSLRSVRHQEINETRSASKANANANANAMRFEVSRHNKAEVISNGLAHGDFQKQNSIKKVVLMNNFMMDDEPEMEGKMTHNLEVIDDKFIEEIEEDADDIEVHRDKDSNDSSVRRHSEARKGAEDLAIRLLAARAFTAVDLTKKLHAKRFSPAITEAVVNDFKSRGLINDGLYAETFSRSRWSSSCWGPRRIKQELFKKGVSKIDADEAIKLVFEDGDSSGWHGSGLSLSSAALDHLFAQASRQWLRSQGMPIDTRKSRIIRWLQYRGFNWGVVSVILRKLDSQAQGN